MAFAAASDLLTVTILNRITALLCHLNMAVDDRVYSA
jgi:Flp pilus assembly protein protease CpaA